MAEVSIFTKIINREIPAKIVFENDEFIAFHDVQPSAPVHVLLVPKHHYITLEEFPESDEGLHGRLLLAARKVVKELGIADNYQLFMNVGLNVQDVHHVHLHIKGGWKNSPEAS